MLIANPVYQSPSFKQASKEGERVVQPQLFGPNNFGGWSYRLTPLRLSIRRFVLSSVHSEFFSVTNHRVLLSSAINQLFMSLKKWRRPIQKNLSQIWVFQVQSCPNLRLLAMISSLKKQISLILHIVSNNHYHKHTMVMWQLKRNFRPEFGPLQAQTWLIIWLICQERLEHYSVVTEIFNTRTVVDACQLGKLLIDIEDVRKNLELNLFEGWSN